MLILVALPTAIVLYKFLGQTNRAAVQEKHQRLATEIANSIFMDYMRQLSQDPYNGHYDPTYLQRPVSNYNMGFSSVTYQPDPTRHTLFLKGVGNFGAPGAATSRRVIETLIHFQPDIAMYGDEENGCGPIGAPTPIGTGTMENGWYVNSSFDLVSPSIIWNGDVILNGGIFHIPAGVNPPPHIRGNFYVCNGNVTGPGAGTLIVDLNRFNFCPPMTWPTLDMNYYAAHSNYIYNSNTTLQFLANGTFTASNAPIGPNPIPASGVIIYCQGANCNFSISNSQVNGLVTVVAGKNVTMLDNLVYANGLSTGASQGFAFAALAQGKIFWDNTGLAGAGKDLTTTGVYFSATACLPCCAMAITLKDPAKSWTVFGATAPGLISSNTGNFNQNYDANLKKYQPTGLPERAIITGYRIKG